MVDGEEKFVLGTRRPDPQNPGSTIAERLKVVPLIKGKWLEATAEMTINKINKGGYLDFKIRTVNGGAEVKS